MTYGTIIKQAREEHCLTQEQLAEELDISRQAVSKWEADLSKPTREKLARLSELLDIPPEKWMEIDAEMEAAKTPPDNSRPWKIATAILGGICIVLLIALISALHLASEQVDRVTDDVPEKVTVPMDEEIPHPQEDEPAPDTISVPEIIPLGVTHDYTFGDWLLGDYDRSEIVFLDDGEKMMDHELWAGWFPDGTRLALVKCPAYYEEWESSNLYVVWAPPAESTGGSLDYRILYRAGEDYAEDDSGTLEVVPFENVLGFDGFKLTFSAPEDFYRLSHYFAQREDGSVCLITSAGDNAREADVDEDGVLEIIFHDRNWEIIDTKSGEEGAFHYTLNDADWLSSDPYVSGFDDMKKAFVTLDANNTVVARYILCGGEMLKVPETDFSVADYPDVAGTKITFIVEGESLSDGYGPDVILPYNPEVRITHRQQAYIALQELYELTGLKLDSCFCAAGEFGVLFSLLPDGFNQRSFYDFYFNKNQGGYNDDNNISSIHIDWQELGNDWSPLAYADAAKPEGGSVAERMQWYFDRLSVLHTGEVTGVNFVEHDREWSSAGAYYDGQIWVNSKDLFNVAYRFIDHEPVLTDIYGPYLDGIVNH